MRNIGDTPGTKGSGKTGTILIGLDQQGRTIPAGHGSLAYKRGNLTRVFRFWIEEIEQPHTLSGTQAQSQFFNHFYAKSYAAQPVTVTGRVRDQFMYDDLAQYIRDHQLLLVSTRGSNNPSTDAADYQLPLIYLRVPSEGLVYAGFIEHFTAGARRFNVAPQFTFAFTSIEDRHSTNEAIVPSHAIRSVFSGAFLSGPVEQQQEQQQIQQQSSAAALKANTLTQRERFATPE